MKIRPSRKKPATGRWHPGSGKSITGPQVSPLSCEIVFLQSYPMALFSRRKATSVPFPIGRIETSQRFKAGSSPTVTGSLQLSPPSSE